MFYLPNYLDLYDHWLTGPHPESRQIPLYIKIIPFCILFVIYLILRLRKADSLEITFFSILLMFSFMAFAKVYMRYITPLVYYGHLKTNDEILIIDLDLKVSRLHFKVGNIFLTYALSILACLIAIVIIIFLFNHPLFR